ncbi:hypothetical protein KY285_013155 [Solanum tuberosum]|nr:hypothetical protein KY285_013155 [Solanum tuberosum]
MSVVEEQLIVLEVENLELREKLKMLSKKCGRGNGEASSLQIDLEISLNTAETKLLVALEKNNQLERDLVRVKEELNKSLEWTTSSKLLAKLTNRGQNDRKGLGISRKSPSYNLHSKDVSMSDNLLCHHCGHDDHLKKDCLAWKRTQDNLSDYFKQKKGPSRASSADLKKISPPHWTKNSFNTLLSAYWELRLKWVPKANK